MIKALSETKTEAPKTPKPKTPKSKHQKQKIPEPEPEPKIRVKTDKEKLKNLRKDFNELRHKFDKEEIDRYRKYFYVAKNKKYLSESELNKTNKNLNELEKSLIFKKFNNSNDIGSVYYEDLDNYDDDDDDDDDDEDFSYADDDKYRKIRSIRALFKKFDRDYYKPIITNRSFDGRENNYIEYE